MVETEKHKVGSDGILQDGVGSRPAAEQDLATYDVAGRQLGELNTPVFRRAGKSNEMLYVASFDGTGNDGLQDPWHATNIKLIADQVHRSNKAGVENVRGGYEQGIGTKGNPIERGYDLATGHSYESRIEEEYFRFCGDAKKWLATHPGGQIRVADIGFSRGAEEAASFARLVHERGIMDPDSRVVHHNHLGHDTVEYTRNMVPPGTVAQAVGLFDPVGTGKPRDFDRRLPPSVLSAFQITSRDEQRGTFKSTDIVDPGMSADGRMLNVMVAGCHSDLGGGYHHNGLSIRAGNLMVDYLNSLSDKPFLAKTPEPMDARLNVIHRSEEGLLAYELAPKANRGKAEGHVQLLTPAPMCGKVPDCRNNEPVDHGMDSKFKRHPVPVTSPAHPSHAAFNAISSGVDADPRLGALDATRSSNLKAGLLLQYERERIGLGMTGIDHVVSNRSGDRTFLIQGDLRDPSHRRMSADNAPLFAMPAGSSLAALDPVVSQRQALAAEQSASQQQHPHPVHQAPLLVRA